MSDNVRGALPPAPKIRMEIVRVTSHESHTFICYSKAIWGQYVHWYARRTHECTQDKTKVCEGCAKGWPTKWKGYLHVQNIAASWNGFLEITDTAFLLIDKQLGDNKNLRGLRFRLSRTKGGPKGRYLVEVYTDRIPDAELPIEKDPYDTLKYLWSCKRPAGQAE